MNMEEIIEQEFKGLMNFQVSNLGLTVGTNEKKKFKNISKWNISLLGPKDSLYRGGLFFLEIIFPKEYPIKAPSIHFLTPIYHINVNHHTNSDPPVGEVYFNIIKNWNPSTKIKDLLIKLYSIFYFPNPNFFYCQDIANEYKNNKSLYEAKAQYFTYKYTIASYNNERNCNWDFSDYELIAFKREKEIGQHDYNPNEIISLSFSLLDFDDISILCKLGELTSIVIKRFMDKCSLNLKGDILYICNSKNLKLNESIGYNDLRDGFKITIIYDF